MTPDQVRDIVRTRDGSRCLRCGRSVLNTPSALHHRKIRGNGGSKLLDTIPNMVHVCGRDNYDTRYCHGQIHQASRQARIDGWIVSRFTSKRPEDIPVLSFHGWVLLTADGDYVHLDGLGTEVVG